MPRLARVNLLGVLLAAIAIYVVGALWFGVLFHELWQTSNGYTEAQLVESFSPAIVFGGGAVIPLILAFAMGWLMKLARIEGMAAAMAFGAKLALLVAAPVLAYGFVYNIIHSPIDLALDIGHSLVGMSVGAAVLSLFD